MDVCEDGFTGKRIAFIVPMVLMGTLLEVKVYSLSFNKFQCFFYKSNKFSKNRNYFEAISHDRIRWPTRVPCRMTNQILLRWSTKVSYVNSAVILNRSPALARFAHDGRFYWMLHGVLTFLTLVSRLNKVLVCHLKLVMWKTS